MEKRNGRTILHDYLWMEVPFLNDNIPGQNCANRELVLAGKYHIHRKGNRMYEINLFAKIEQLENDMDPNTLAKFVARTGVLVGHEFIDHGSKWCLELIGKFVQFLLNDPKVIANGGRMNQIKGSKLPMFVGRNNAPIRERALYCETIVEADLHEPGIGFRAEIGARYLLGAVAAGYHMVFFHNRTAEQDDPDSRWAVAYLPKILQDVLGPNIPWEFQLAFVQALADDRGDLWFFCYCALDPKTNDVSRDCLDITTM